MDFVSGISPQDLTGKRLISESSQFAVYAMGGDSYLLVQRHAGTAWTGLRMSGDGVFRISGLLNDATRDLYRVVAGQLSPSHRE